MEWTIWLSFVGTVIILAITPGPSVLLATANSMKYGKGKTIGTIVGDLSANLCQIISLKQYINKYYGPNTLERK